LHVLPVIAADSLRDDRTKDVEAGRIAETPEGHRRLPAVRVRSRGGKVRAQRAGGGPVPEQAEIARGPALRLRPAVFQLLEQERRGLRVPDPRERPARLVADSRVP